MSKPNLDLKIEISNHRSMRTFNPYGESVFETFLVKSATIIIKKLATGTAHGATWVVH